MLNTPRPCLPLPVRLLVSFSRNQEIERRTSRRATSLKFSTRTSRKRLDCVTLRLSPTSHTPAHTATNAFVAVIHGRGVSADHFLPLRGGYQLARALFSPRQNISIRPRVIRPPISLVRSRLAAERGAKRRVRTNWRPKGLFFGSPGEALKETRYGSNNVEERRRQDRDLRGSRARERYTRGEIIVKRVASNGAPLQERAPAVQ